MHIESVTWSNNTASNSSPRPYVYAEDGSRVFPCRCGVTHSGLYAEEDWNHHNCLHAGPLDAIGPGQVTCMDCGATWVLRAQGIVGTSLGAPTGDDPDVPGGA